MVRNRVYIQQSLVCQDNGYIRNEYHFGDDFGNYLGGICFPNDGRYLDDEQALEEITLALAIRWEFISRCKKYEHHKLAKSGIMVRQSQNVFHFGMVKGHYLGWLMFPADDQLLANMLTLEQIVYVLAIRWGLIRADRKK